VDLIPVMRTFFLLNIPAIESVVCVVGISLAGGRRRGYFMRVMHDPFELVIWAIAIVICWEILAGATGFQDAVKHFFGRKDTVKELEEQVKALEARVKELEGKKT
jgi:hypothetical protein